MRKPKQTIVEVLERLQKDLNTASTFLEDRGFASLVSKLDSAADHVDSVLDDLESLEEAA